MSTMSKESFTQIFHEAITFTPDKFETMKPHRMIKTSSSLLVSFQNKSGNRRRAYKFTEKGHEIIDAGYATDEYFDRLANNEWFREVRLPETCTF